MSNPPPTRVRASYAYTALGTLLLTSACVALFCFVMDPYRLYPAISRISPERSVDLFYHLRVQKPYAIERVRPAALIAGNSRSALLSPRALMELDGIAYNATVPGASLREIRLIAEHAQAVRPLNFLMVGLDFQMFQKGSSEQVFQGEEYRYRRVNATVSQELRHCAQRARDNWRSLFSTDAAIDSLRVLQNAGSNLREYRKDGTWDLDGPVSAPPMQRYRTMTRLIHGIEKARQAGQVDFSGLKELLVFAEQHRIRLVLLISPLHGLLMHAVNQAGSWEQYLDWQKELVSLAEPYGSDVAIYGVENIPALVLEPIGAPKAMFRDGLHGTQLAGRHLAACLTGPCDSPVQPTQLDTRTIEAYLDEVDALRRQYEREHPTILQKAKRWMGITRRVLPS